jgi:hypothetical protein
MRLRGDAGLIPKLAAGLRVAAITTDIWLLKSWFSSALYRHKADVVCQCVHAELRKAVVSVRLAARERRGI